MKTKNILFDLDGTLINSLAVIFDCFAKTLEKLGSDKYSEKIVRAGIGKDLASIFDDLDPNLDTDKAIEIYRSFYLPIQERDEIPFFADTKTVLETLYNQGYTLGIVTTKHSGHSRELLERNNLMQYLSVLIGANDVNYYKPHPEPLLRACAKLKIKPENAIYIGDATHDGLAAKTAKMPFLGVSTGAAKAEDLAAYGQVFNNLSEVLRFIEDSSSLIT